MAYKTASKNMMRLKNFPKKNNKPIKSKQNVLNKKNKKKNSKKNNKDSYIKYNEVLEKAKEWGVEVVYCNGIIEFHYNDEMAEMHYIYKRKWAGIFKYYSSRKKMRKEGLKGSVAKWCLASVLGRTVEWLDLKISLERKDSKYKNKEFNGGERDKNFTKCLICLKLLHKEELKEHMYKFHNLKI